MAVRQAERGDGPKLVELLRASDSSAHVRFNSFDIEHALDVSGTESVFVAEVSARLVGFATVQVTESFAYVRPTAELTNLFVLPGFRRDGIGRQLLSAAIAHSEARGALELFARVNQSNSAALELYQSMGLQRADHFEYRLKYY